MHEYLRLNKEDAVALLPAAAMDGDVLLGDVHEIQHCRGFELRRCPRPALSCDMGSDLSLLVDDWPWLLRSELLPRSTPAAGDMQCRVDGVCGRRGSDRKILRVREDNALPFSPPQPTKLQSGRRDIPEFGSAWGDRGAKSSEIR